MTTPTDVETPAKDIVMKNITNNQVLKNNYVTAEKTYG